MTQVTLITGTRKGIGRYLAEHYAQRGHHVIGCSRGDAGLSHERYEHHTLDVADEHAVKSLFNRIRRQHRRLDHLINNAGIGARNAALLTPLETVGDVLTTNVAGTFLFCREAAKLMMRRGGGRIVNFGSTAVALTPEGSAIYAASKAAVLVLTRMLAKEFAPFQISVNAVSPSPIDTDLLGGIPESELERLLERQAIPRTATFAEVAAVVDFYLDPSSGFVTGQNIFLGGVW